MMRRLVPFVLLLFVLPLLARAAAGDPESADMEVPVNADTGSASGDPTSSDPPKIVYDRNQRFDPGHPNHIAVIEVDGWGVIKIELFEDLVPITTANFITLARSGFYDGIKFHRCIDNFVAQTGDPNTKDNNPYDDGSGGSDQTIPLEIHPNASHVDGGVGMARSSEPDSASSQFYICDGAQGGLDDWNSSGDGYAVFGVVVEGLEVAHSIARCRTYEDVYGNTRPLLKDHPVEDIVMGRVYIIAGEEDGESTNATSSDSSLTLPEIVQSPFPFWFPLILAVVLVLAVRPRYRRIDLRARI